MKLLSKKSILHTGSHTISIKSLLLDSQTVINLAFFNNNMETIRWLLRRQYFASEVDLLMETFHLSNGQATEMTNFAMDTIMDRIAEFDGQTLGHIEDAFTDIICDEFKKDLEDITIEPKTLKSYKRVSKLCLRVAGNVPLGKDLTERVFQLLFDDCIYSDDQIQIEIPSYVYKVMNQHIIETIFESANIREETLAWANDLKWPKQ